MKNVFSFDAEGRQPYNNFIIKESDAEVVAKQDATLKAICAFEKKYSLPIYLKVIMYICAFVAAMVILGVLDAVIDGLPFAEAYGNAPWLFYVGGACFVVFVVLLCISRYLDFKGSKSPEFQRLTQEVNEVTAESYSRLGVPDDARGISVLAYHFRIKRGKEKPAAYVSHAMQEMKIYFDGDNLYIASLHCLTAIPFADIRAVVENKKRTAFIQWTKDKSYRSPEYKRYKVRAFQYGLATKTYSVRIASDGAEAEILIPNFEIETLKTFLSLPIQPAVEKKNK